jgi:imidazole glycerol-phosphate synthase subunit HisF
MGLVIVKDDIAVQSIGFKRYLPIGRPEVIVDYLNGWGIDEISVLDINAGVRGVVNLDLLARISRYCQVPLTFGGGLRSVQDMVSVLKHGADRIMINQAILHDADIIDQATQTLGHQCVVAAINTIGAGSEAVIYDYVEDRPLDTRPWHFAQVCQWQGAGEIFLTFADRDGSKRGYDTELARLVACSLEIPVTICGGVGVAKHFAEGLAIPNISAVAAANFFNFTEHSVVIAKQVLIQEHGAPLRLDTQFNYEENLFDEDNRPGKIDDSKLRELQFEYHTNEMT